MTILLQGIVGSTAYGLSREGSDVDRLGVFAAATVDVAGLDWNGHCETKVSTDPDTTLHEVGKYLRLALKCNPTITELMWLPSKYIEIMEPFFGARLIAVREKFLSTPLVRDAYGGYAKAQAFKLCVRVDSFSSDTKKRTVKHARHMLRLIRQGTELLSTGKLTVQVSNPEEYFAFDNMTPDQMQAVYARELPAFENAVEHSVLPDKPDKESISQLLEVIRSAYLWGSEEDDDV